MAELTLKPADKSLAGQPGQFAYWQFFTAGISSESHPFSLTNPPESKRLNIAVKNDGDYTKKLINLHPGAPVLAEGPYGRFLLAQGKKRQIWMAGGIGIAPFLSLARSRLLNRFVVDLYYVVRYPEEAVYLPELQAIAGKTKTFRVFPYYSAKQSRFKADYILKNSPDIKQADIYLCGLAPMMKDLRQQLVALNLPNDRIHSEEFSFL